MTWSYGKRWCAYHRVWEDAPRCVECGKTAKMQRFVPFNEREDGGQDGHRWYWPCGHAAENAKAKP